MSAKSFKFVSPGVFINEIDNSFIPKSADAIGPVVIGRASRGLAMQPIKVQSYSDFVEMFGDTVAGAQGGDIYRDGNYQSPMYGTYAAKAFLRSNVAPLTYIRLLGHESTAATAAGKAGWKTTNPLSSGVTAGGAYGLWIFPSASVTATDLGSGQLAAVWYMDEGNVELSGSLHGGGSAQGTGIAIENDSDNLFTVVVSGSRTGEKTVKFGTDPSAETFLRKRFNTNPQLLSTAGAFYASASAEDVWLGETYEQEIRDASLTNTDLFGVILGIASGSVAPSLMQANSSEAVAGWFIGQDLSGNPTSFAPATMPKLLRLKGRGHGEWLHKNVKVSIENIKPSTTTATDYGTFAIVLRALGDRDGAEQVMERFDNLTLDPASPDYVARRIGDTYSEWSQTERRLRTYGDYPSQSKFVYVEMNADVEAGATDPALLPVGYFGPPRFSTHVHNPASVGTNNSFVQSSGSIPGAGADAFLSGAAGDLTGSMAFPSVRLRASASDGGLSDRTDAHFGMMTSTSPSSTTHDLSVADPHRLLYAGLADDPSASTIPGVDSFSYVFSLDDISGSSNGVPVYVSGSRASETAQSLATTLGAGYGNFTAPFWGGFDGFDIKVPDPVYNAGMADASTDETSYIYNTYKRAIDTVADPESLDMNLMAIPGLTHESLTNAMINTCEARADAMAIIDLPNAYTPSHESYIADKKDRLSTPATMVANLKTRQIDSSYGTTFYPWVQTRDAGTGRLLWIPPSVAMMGVLASSERKSAVWFAPAGFNRGGLSDGAAGIPVTNVTQRLTSKDRDLLYEADINPIASFPSSGIVVFGQKTLQQSQSSLDRINVRRLVIYLKKQISILSTQVLFEQNVQSTWNRFKGLVEPFLANTKVQFGITDYKLILDESTTTPDLIDQNIMYAKIMVKPARAIEYIAIDFVIASTGASFDD